MIYPSETGSGAHFNPVVTVAIMCAGRDSCLPPRDGAMYMVVQFLGGLCAAFTYAAMKGGMKSQLKPDAHGGADAIVAVFIFTFVLALCRVLCGDGDGQLGSILRRCYPHVRGDWRLCHWQDLRRIIEP